MIQIKYTIEGLSSAATLLVAAAVVAAVEDVATQVICLQEADLWVASKSLRLQQLQNVHSKQIAVGSGAFAYLSKLCDFISAGSDIYQVESDFET